MIVIDYREETVTKKAKNADLIEPLKRAGSVPVVQGDLQYGDAAFEGVWGGQTIAVGIERKTLSDMLGCIDDARYTGHQRIGMKELYQVSILMLEAHWKPHDPSGVLMQGYHNGTSWGFNEFRRKKTMYHKVYRYLLSVAMSGVIVTYSRDPFHTAFNILECYHYFQKAEHTSLLEMQKLNIPTLNQKPSLTRQWAASLDGIGVKLSEDAERLFKSPIELANSDELDWLRISGVGVKTAQSIYRDIRGIRK